MPLTVGTAGHIDHGKTWLVRALAHVLIAEHPQHGDPLRRIEVEHERSLEGRQRQLVCAKCALERVPAQALDEVGPADDDPGLRAAEELVAGERHEVGACGKALLGRRLPAK